MLGEIDRDGSAPSNERSPFSVPSGNRDQLIRNKMVKVESPDGTSYLARILSGPFFPDLAGPAFGELELMGEMREGRPGDTNRRPPPGSRVEELSLEEIVPLI